MEPKHGRLQMLSRRYQIDVVVGAPLHDAGARPIRAPNEHGRASPRAQGVSGWSTPPASGAATSSTAPPKPSPRRRSWEQFGRNPTEASMRRRSFLKAGVAAGVA